MALSGKTKRWAAISALCVFLALLSVHLPVARNLALTALVHWIGANLGGTVEIEELDYRLWLGEVTVRGLHVAPAPERLPIELQAREARIEWRPFRGVFVRVRAPRLVVLPGRDSGEEAREPSLVRFPNAISHLAIEEGLVVLVSGSGEPWVELPHIEAEVSTRGVSTEGIVRSSAGWIRAPGQKVSLGAIQARFGIARGQLQVHELLIEEGPNRARGQGILTSLSPFTARLNLDYRLDAALSRAFAGPLLSGEVQGRAEMDAAAGGLQIRSKLHSDELRSDRLGTWMLDAELAFQGGGLDVESATLRGYGGTLEGHGSLDLERGVGSFGARISDLQLQAMSQILVESELPLSSSLSGTLDFQLFGWSPEQLRGGGRLTLRPLTPSTGIPLEGIVHWSAESGIVGVESRGVAFPDGQVAFRGESRWDGDFRASYELRSTEIRGLDPLFAYVDLPLPPDLSGQVTLQGDARGSWRDPRSIESELSIRSDRVVFRGMALEMDGRARLADERLLLDSLVLQARQGRIIAQGVVPLTAEGVGWDLATRLEELDISELAQSIYTGVQGLARGTIHVHGKASDPDGTASLALKPLRVGDLDGEAQIVVEKQGARVSVSDLKAVWGSASGEASGSYDLDTGRVSARVQARQVRLDEIYLVFLQERGAGVQLAGVVPDFIAELQGVLPALEGRARWSVEDLTLGDVELPSLRIDAHSDGRSATGEVHDGEGRRLAEIVTDLESPYRTRASVDLSNVPLSRLLRAFFPSTPEDTEVVAQGRLEISIPLTEPGEFEYRLQVDEMAGVYRGIGGGTASTFVIEGDRESVTVSELDLTGAGTAVAVGGRLPLTRKGMMDLTLRGHTRLELFNSLSEDIELRGEAGLDVHLGGTPVEPVLKGELTVEDSAATWGALRTEAVNAVLQADGESIQIATWTGEWLGGSYRVAGEIPLPAPSESRPARCHFEAEAVDLARLVPFEGTVSVQPSVRVDVSGSMESTGLGLTGLRGSGEVSALRAALGDSMLESGEPASWSLERLRFHMPRLHLVGDGTDLAASLTLQIPGDAWSWVAAVQGNLNNTLANIPLQTAGDLLLSGETDLDVEVHGSEQGISFRGRGSTEGARVVVRNPPLSFSNVNVRVELDDPLVRVEELSAEAGGGKVEGSGTFRLSGRGAIEGADVQATVTSVRLNVPEGMRSEVTGALQLTGGQGDLLLSGDLSLLRSSFERNITLETEMMSSIERQARIPIGEQSFGERMHLDVGVSTEEDLHIDNNLAKLDADASLRLTGTLAFPVVDGILRAKPEGTFRLGRNVYRIDSGSAVLSGYPGEPVELDLRARTTVAGVDILLEIRGRPDDLVTELTAPDRPDLTRADIASLLVTGRTLENVSDFETVSGHEGRVVGEQMVSYFGGALADLAQQGLGQALPFDQVSVTPAQIGSEVKPEIRFNLGKAVTDDLFVTYSVGLENTQSQIWILDYQLPKRLAVRATRQEDNTFSGSLSQRLYLNRPGRPPSPALRAEERRVASVELAGAPESVNERLHRAIHIEAGDRYNYWETQQDVERLSRVLREGGYLGAVVDVEAHPTDDGGIGLRYAIEPGRVVRVRWQGDDAGKSIRETTERSWDGRIDESFLVADLARQATWSLQRERFYTAKVTASAEDAPDGSREVTFHVVKGPRGKRVSLEFPGNRALNRRELTESLPSTSSVEFFALLSGSDGRLQRALRAAYLFYGYLDARIGKPEVDYETGSGTLRVVIPVEEGRAPRVTDVILDGVLSLDEKTVRDDLRIVAGLPFRLSDYQGDRANLASIYRRQGFTETRIGGRLERKDNELRVVYEIREGPRAEVGSIRVVGNHRTSEDIIRREATFDEGDPLRYTALTETQRRLYELGIFRSADVRVGARNEESPARDVVIDVRESADFDVSYGLRFSSEKNVEVLSELRVPNVLGAAQHAGLTFLVNDEESIVRGSYHIPYFWRYRLSTDVFVSRETDDEEFFYTKLWRFTFQQQRDLSKDLDVQWSYTYSRGRTLGKVTDSPFPFDFLTKQSILTASLIEDGRDNLIQPTRGRFWNVTFQISPQALGSNIQFIKLHGQLFYFHTLWRDLVWASSYRMGVGGGFGQALLPQDRFTAGGANSVRGFDQDALGPVDPITDTVVGGEAVVVYNQELRFPLYKWFRGVTFYDAGNVFLEAGDFRPFDLRHSAGLGLRLVLPFGLLRFDYAWVLDRQPGEKASRYWFSLNHAF